MPKCKYCNKDVTELDTLDIFINDEFNETVECCPDCAKIIKETSEEPDFGQRLLAYAKDLEENWEKGTKENTKVGSIIRIISLKDEKDNSYFDATGVVDYIDDKGQLHGTWGGLAVIPEVDKFLVAKEK